VGGEACGGLNIPRICVCVCMCVCVCVCVSVHARAVPFCMTPRSDEIARLAPTNAARDLAIRLMYLGRGRQIPFRQSTHSHIVKHSTHTHTHTHTPSVSFGMPSLVYFSSLYACLSPRVCSSMFFNRTFVSLFFFTTHPIRNISHFNPGTLTHKYPWIPE